MSLFPFPENGSSFWNENGDGNGNNDMVIGMKYYVCKKDIIIFQVINFLTPPIQQNACLAWDFTDHSVSLRRIFLTQNQIVNQVNIFFSAALRDLPLPVNCWLCWCLLIFFSRLLMLLFIHHLFGNSFVNSISLYPFNRYKFFIKILSSSLKTMFTNTAVPSAMT